MNLKRVALLSVLWLLLRGAIRQGINSIVFVILALFLTPQQFGLGSIAVAAGMLARLMLDRGLRDAVIQTQGPTTADYLDTAWTLSAVFGAALAGVLVLVGLAFVFAVQGTALGWLIACAGAIPLFAGLSAVSEGYIERNFRQQQLSIVQSICSALSGGAALFLAVWGFGAWSVVMLNVVEAAMFAVANNLLARHAPRLRIVASLAREQLEFAWPIAVVGLFNGSFFRVALLIVGASFGAAAAAQFRVGSQIYIALAQLALGPVARALLPVFARHAGDLASAYQKAIAAYAGLCVPVFFGLAGISPALIQLLLGPQWATAGTISALLCFVVMSTFIGHPLEAALLVHGESGPLMGLSLLENVLGILIIGVTATISIYAVALGMALHGIVCLITTSAYAKHYLRVPIWASLAPVVYFSLAGLIIFGVARLVLGSAELARTGSGLVSIILAIVSGVIIYPTLVRFGIRRFAPSAYSPLANLVPERLQRFI